ncbi:hypothetical protein [Bacillus cereus]|uniref:hypothetical protein n=1 Tax=Bacillus cereus TaxID=1396 RepID=UPI0015D49F2D|nr:hypothetical protein [Bacillus cereus]
MNELTKTFLTYKEQIQNDTKGVIFVLEQLKNDGLLNELEENYLTEFEYNYVKELKEK